ncbi:MAG: hypothetical protein JSW70_01015 [Syntrophobacterales bacterium]|nr:MAG: hypothetical protein JSW70_01015 [Syntrophobacterales bacterium]
MEDLKTRRYVMSLENKVEMNYHFLDDIQDEFRERCKMVAPGKPFPGDVVSRVKRQYKEIRDRLAEIRAVQQLLRGKYRRSAKRNPLRDKRIDELGFALKNYYSSFEFNLRTIERLKRKLEQEKMGPRALFRGHENNLKFKEGLKLLGRREGGYLCISVVFLKGDSASIEGIYERGIRLKEGDVFEKYGEDEIRMSIAHGEESENRRIQEVIRRRLLYEGYKSIKCAIYRVEEQRDLARDVQGLLYKTLESMGNKELKVVR